MPAVPPLPRLMLAGCCYQNTRLITYRCRKMRAIAAYADAADDADAARCLMLHTLPPLMPIRHAATLAPIFRFRHLR